ncbi:hypothetical protein SMF913_28889 [Streptomyces malaysiensis]|uniref:Uncharacterized protein n=1 Tax=Streptomyces malaysiensis TaxID=92644 RepID=A0A2J7YZG8_STRMQ|nr:hypothetical protein SMF913_28889 [Streptomyces malaysiensis]
MEHGFGDSGRLGIAQTELAVKAAYYMAVSEPMALQREVFGGSGDEDDRTLPVVVRAMLSRRRGVFQAYEIVRAGRRGQKLYEVDEAGMLTLTAGGETRELSDSLVRHTYNGEPLAEVASGFKAASLRWADVTTAVEALKKSVANMARVPIHVGGANLVERDGWESEQVSSLRSKLDRIDRTLADWADRYDDLDESGARESEEHA